LNDIRTSPNLQLGLRTCAITKPLESPSGLKLIQVQIELRVPVLHMEGVPGLNKVKRFVRRGLAAVPVIGVQQTETCKSVVVVLPVIAEATIFQGEHYALFRSEVNGQTGEKIVKVLRDDRRVAPGVDGSA